MPRPPLNLQTTTLWDYPSAQYGKGQQGNPAYTGATPSYIIWNLLRRYTRTGDLVVDPMAGSGTALDVAADLGRKAAGFDVNVTRDDIIRADARDLPLGNSKADFVFVDPPYSTHITYSDASDCIGRLSADGPAYLEAMEMVIAQIDRVLKRERYMALYVSDSFKKGRPLMPIGPDLFGLLRRHFVPVDIIAVTRHNADLKKGNYRKAADEQNFFLRGFNYLFIMYKPGSKGKIKFKDRRGKPLDRKSEYRNPKSETGKKKSGKRKRRKGRLPGKHTPPFGHPS